MYQERQIEFLAVCQLVWEPKALASTRHAHNSEANEVGGAKRKVVVERSERAQAE
jgi:hypothetical protein